jgi:hypothetical protein
MHRMIIKFVFIYFCLFFFKYNNLYADEQLKNDLTFWQFTKITRINFLKIMNMMMQ